MRKLNPKPNTGPTPNARINLIASQSVIFCKVKRVGAVKHTVASLNQPEITVTVVI